MTGRKNNMYVLFICCIFLMIWFVLYLYKVLKDKNEVEILDKTEGSFYDSQDKFLKNMSNFATGKTESRIKSVWSYMAIFILVCTTLFYGGEVCSSAVNYNGKLSWLFEELFNKKIVEFTHNNIYSDGVEGLFHDIRKKINMPDDLYISNSMNLNFSKDGTINSIDTFVYGRDEKNKLKTFRISYDKQKSENIFVYINESVNESYSQDKILQPFFDTMNIINIKDDIERWEGEDKYEVLYVGKRNWGYNTEEIRYINKDGKIENAQNASKEIVGYTVSLYVPEREKIYTPIKYNLKYMQVGRDPQGNYNNECRELYKSYDNGVTWVYVKEIT